jgi:hypothetical protein
MKKLRTALVFLPFLFQFQTSFGCDCAPSPDNFCQSLRYNEHVALVKVVANNGLFMDVVILDEIWNSFSEDTITVIGQDGVNCSQWLSIFNLTDTLILGLQDWDMVDTFNLSACGMYYLSYSGGQVTGNINPSSSSESYPAFKADLATCSPLAVDNETQIERVSVSFQNHLATISSKSDPIHSVQVFALNGALVHDSGTMRSNTFTFDTSALRSGVYIFEVNRESGVSILKQMVP